MGGTDEHDYSLKALKASIKNKNVKKIDLVVGSFYKYNSALVEFIKQNSTIQIKVHCNLSEKEICLLMKKSGLNLY